MRRLLTISTEEWRAVEHLDFILAQHHIGLEEVSHHVVGDHVVSDLTTKQLLELGLKERLPSHKRDVVHHLDLSDAAHFRKRLQDLYDEVLEPKVKLFLLNFVH